MPTVCRDRRGPTYDVTRNKFAGLDLLFLAVTNDSASHSNITLQGGDDIRSLLFLVPTDDSVEHKNTNNDTKIDPVTKTGSEEDGKFHNCRHESIGAVMDNWGLPMARGRAAAGRAGCELTIENWTGEV